MTMIQTGADAGTLDATGTIDVPAIQGGGFRPFTVSLASVAANRQIQMSMDGVDWHPVAYDTFNSVEIAVRVLSPVMRVRFTGAQNDAWRMY